MHGFISGLSILFHWFIFLFLCQYHIVLMTAVLQDNRKSGRLIPPAPFFFLKIALAIRGLLCFHVLAMINSAAMNIGVHVSLSDMVSLVCMPRSGIAGSISGLSILFHWSILLFLCQYHTVLMTVAL